MPNLKLGRLPRHFNPAVPHMSALLADKSSLPPPPDEVTYIDALPDDSGMMLNDSLGDCTIAAMYHAIQLWTATTSKMQTAKDSDVLAMYELICGYNPADPSTDQGGIEQHVLHEWLMRGIPLNDTDGNPFELNKLESYFEVDPRIEEDVKRVIWECGCCYIGFEVPSNIFPPDGDPPKLWQYQRGAGIVGGHAVVLCGYDAEGPTLLSWGAKYKMTWEFFSRLTDEAYAIVNPEWANATGKTPLGMSLGTLTHQMRMLKWQWGEANP